MVENIGNNGFQGYFCFNQVGLHIYFSWTIINSQDMRPITRALQSLCTKVRFQKVETKVEDKIGYIYLNSPSDFNALSQTMRSAISEAVRSYEASNDVKVILMLSKVPKAFCAGANIKEFQGKTSKDF